jgi:adenine-specific DNA methylase
MDHDVRLIEAGFPCHQVGAETQRERGASSALPPLYFLHVWWARRPLTPSRAAILASLLPADTDPDWFLRQLGIEKPVAEVNGATWVLTGPVLDKVAATDDGGKVLPVDERVRTLLAREDARRAENRATIMELMAADESLANDPVLQRWQQESQLIPQPWPEEGAVVPVRMVAADPAWFKDLMALAGQRGLRVPNLYGYDRAYLTDPEPATVPQVVLDPTAGGGSIPFEALRLGHKVIANELNPVASVILQATLAYPALFGPPLADAVQQYGNRLLGKLSSNLDDVFPREFSLPEDELVALRQHLKGSPNLVEHFNKEQTTTFLYCRQVTCPHCGGEAPLLNTCWLSKEAGKQWGVRVVTDGRERGGTVRFATYRVHKGRGPNGEDPSMATVHRGVGTCIHCRQAIEADEIKRQARGESEHGTWKDRLYCVVAVRFQPKLDKHGQPQRYATGARQGEIKTEKVRFFRPPNDVDLQALQLAEQRLQNNWERWDAAGLIPTETFPQGNDMRPVNYGMPRWCDLFAPRQLLGHLTLIEELNRLKPLILADLGQEKGRAVVTYLQFAIDKGLDYNSRQTRWIAQRAQVSGTFGRHDFSLKWTFGEMIFAGPNSGAAWGLSQIVDAYQGIASLSYREGVTPQVTIRNGTAAYLEGVAEASVDLVCMDPPYYNNVQYAELSDYFYVWQRRTLGDLYPEFFRRRLTNKKDEAVANPARDGSAAEAKAAYERLIGEIFAECRRVVRNDGVMTMMFTHKSQEAWETLTQALIEHGWIITAAMPVESEFANSQHTMDTASAISSIFLTCRKRLSESSEPASWTGFGGTGVAQRIRQAVTEGLTEFAALRLNPVDEMVASYGRALRVLSEQWPVLDGDEVVGPVLAMNEASRVVAAHQIRRITNGRLQVEDLVPEAAMALTLFGIYGLGQFPYDEALNLSKSLNIALETRAGNYQADGRFIGVNTTTATGRRTAARAEEQGLAAPLVRQGSKLRLTAPGERDERRILQAPQTEWDLLHGLLIAHEQGDLPVARAYLDQKAAGKKELVIDLLHVWAEEITDETLRRQARELHFGLT